MIEKLIRALCQQVNDLWSANLHRRCIWHEYTNWQIPPIWPPDTFWGQG